MKKYKSMNWYKLDNGKIYLDSVRVWTHEELVDMAMHYGMEFVMSVLTDVETDDRIHICQII